MSTKVVVCAALIAGQKVGFSVPLTCKGLVYAGTHSQYFPLVNKEGTLLEGITLKQRKAGGWSVECSKIIVAEGGRSHVPSGMWHNGLKYSLTIKLETPNLALVTMRLETAGSDIQQIISNIIADDIEVINAAKQLRRMREEAAKAFCEMSVTLSPEEVTKLKVRSSVPATGNKSVPMA